MDQRRRETSEADPQNQQGLFAQLQRYAAKLKTEARIFMERHAGANEPHLYPMNGFVAVCCW